METSDEYDVFLCYAWEDKIQADALYAGLAAAGLSVFQDHQGMRDYDYISDRIDSALQASRILLVLYTPAFPGSEYCRQELSSALLRSHRLHCNRARVLAVVRNVEIEQIRPNRLKCWRLPDPGLPLDRVAGSVADHVHHLASNDDRRLGDAPEALPPTWHHYRPPVDLEFYGRELDLWKVHDALFPDEDLRPTGQVVALTGPGGQGKTMLALHYARLFSHDFPGGVFLLRGLGNRGPASVNGALLRQSLDQQLVQIATRMPGFPTRGGADTSDPAASELSSIGAAIGWLHRHLRTLEPYLWIFDDVPDGIDHAGFDALLAPTGNGRTLLTAQHDLRGWLRDDRQIALAPLERSASLALLTSRWPAGRHEAPEQRLRALRQDRRQYGAASRTVETLGAHPQALALAAGLLGAPDETGVADFSALDLLVADPDRDALVLAEQLRPRSPTDHIAGVAATLLRSIITLRSAALDTLLLASVLGPQPVPESVVAMVFAEADGLAAVRAEQQAGEGVEQLRARCLARPVEAPTDDLGGLAGAVWDIHPVVSRAIRRTGSLQQRRQQLRLAAIAAFTGELDNARLVDRPTTLAAHLSHVGHLAAGMADIDEWHLLNEAGRVHAELGDHQAALQLYKRLYQACHARLGEHDPTTVAVQVGLGVAHLLNGDHLAARRLHESAHALLSDRLGAEDPDTLTALNNLAVAHGAGGDHRRARDIYRAVHEVRERVLGPSHPDSLDALTNYAIAVGRCGDHTDARVIKSELHQIFLSTRGPDHQSTLDALNNLAVTQLHLHDRAGARAMFAEIHAARRRLLGPRRPTADAAENLAVTTDDRVEAAELLTEAYRIRLQVQGPSHHATERTLSRLLRALVHDADEALPVAGAIAVESVPIDVADALPDEGALGAIRLDDDRMDDRIDRLQLAMRLHDQRVAEGGPDDPATAVALCYLAHALAVLDQFDDQIEQAWGLADDAATGLELTLGADDPSTMAAEALRIWISTVETARVAVEPQSEVYTNPSSLPSS